MLTWRIFAKDHIKNFHRLGVITLCYAREKFVFDYWNYPYECWHAYPRPWYFEGEFELELESCNTQALLLTLSHHANDKISIIIKTHEKTWPHFMQKSSFQWNYIARTIVFRMLFIETTCYNVLAMGSFFL